MDYQALRVVHHYVCRGETLENIANSGEHGPQYETRKKVTECVNKYGFATSKKNNGYGETGVSCGIFPGMSFEEFCEHMIGYRGKDGRDFIKKVAQDKAKLLQPNQRQTRQPDIEQQISYSPSSTTTHTKGASSQKNKITIGGIGLVVVIIAAIFLFRNIFGRDNLLNSKNAVNEIYYFTPTLLSGLTVGEMFDGVCEDSSWTTYEVTKDSGLFNPKTVWVRFTGNSTRGLINATFTLTKDSKLDYTCYVGGKPVPLDELYRMFHDPNYDNDLIEAEAEAENQAKFEEAEEKILKMDLVHNYIIDDFNGMTILEFIDSVCTSGEWSSNNKTESLRVIYDGQSDLGPVQAIFNVDVESGTVDGTWYFMSREIDAIDLYQKFYPEQ